MILLIFWLLLPFVFFVLEAPAQDLSKGRPPEHHPGHPVSDTKVPRLSAPLRLSDFIGMKPRPGLEHQLAHITGFIQRQPSDGRSASQKTEVWLGQTATEIDFVFICRDENPSAIRSHLARRENVLKDDTVSVLLDPFQDRLRGIFFKVNPAGVQADASWTENGDLDYSYDQVWNSDGRITPDGWLALIAIPFTSIRSSPLSSDWGVVFRRTIPRNSEKSYWPRVSAGISGVLSQEGTLHGVKGLPRSYSFQVNPYGLMQNERSLINLDPLDPHFSSRHLEGAVGGDIKAVLHNSIVVDGTINPDFSTIESDQPQFTVNQRYPVYFPELRPFFLENANYFSTPIELLYTRNVVNPEFGMRFTGKIGNTNLGLLAIDDRQPGNTYGPTHPLFHRRAFFATGRIAQDIGTGSNIGVIYTDREFGGGWNRIGGLDYTARITEHWSSSGQFVESSTLTPSDPDTPSLYSAGPASYIDVQRDGHSFHMHSSYKDFSSGFQSQTGFIQSTNIRRARNDLVYRWFPKNSVLQSFGAEVASSVAFDHQGNRVYSYLSYNPFFKLSGEITIKPIGGQSSDTLGPQNDYPFTQNRNYTQNYGGLIVSGAPMPQFSFDIHAQYGGNVNYNPISGTVPFLMNQNYVRAVINVQPLHKLTLKNTYLLDRDHAASTGNFVYESQTLRTRVNFQFTRSLSARAIVQYDSTLADPAETSIQRTKQVGTQLLLTWLPHPGTAVYIGYNNDLQNLDRNLCPRTNNLCNPDVALPRANDYLNDDRHIFVKASYLFRF